MTQIEKFLSRLQKVKGKNGSWTACCPAHNDRSPSLAVRELDDGRLLVHCFGGCDTLSVVQSVGLDMTDLFPPDSKRKEYPVEGKPKLERSFYASDLLRVLSFEALVLSVLAYDISEGKTIKEEDRQRAKLAQQRIEEVMQYANI